MSKTTSRISVLSRSIHTYFTSITSPTTLQHKTHGVSPLHKLALSAVVTGLVLPTSAMALTVVDDNEIANQAQMPSTTLDPIIVTATRTPTLADDTIAQTRVIDNEELQRYQGKTVLDVIKNQPGFSYYQNGGMGTAANFYVRGYDSKQVLVLIDGIRYSSISLGQPALNLLPVDAIDRIEVLYGASGSSIYGADAMGGVIQIFSKNAQTNGFAASANVGAGSHSQYQYGASVQFKNDSGTSLSLSASHVKTDGINATLPDNAYAYNPDKDGFESKNYSLSLNQQFNEQLSAGISGLYSDSETDFDNGKALPAYAEQKNGAAQAYINWAYNPNGSVKLQYGQSIDNSTNYGYDSTFDSTQKQVSLVGQHNLTNHNKVIYGAEHLTQSLDSTAYQADDREVTSGFLGYLHTNDSFDAQANVRYDDNSQYGEQTTYNLGGAYHINPQLRIGAGYAKGFRAPSFNELYYPGSGNPSLIPETSDNYEAFAEYNSPLQTTRLTGYQNEVDNLITYVAKPTKDNPYAGSSENVNKAKIQGVSLTSDWYVNDYLFGLSYDYQKALDDGGKENDGKFLPIRPEHKGLVYVGYQLPQADIRAEYQYVGDYYSNVANLDSQKIEHYGLLNLSGNYQLTPQISMTARLNNVTNKKYITLPGYHTDGTNFITSLTYTFK